MDLNHRSEVDSGPNLPNDQHMTQKRALPIIPRGWRRQNPPQNAAVESSASSADEEKEVPPTEKWSLGILNDKRTDEVPGTSLGAPATEFMI
jgi:hypothetical protein